MRAYECKQEKSAKKSSRLSCKKWGVTASCVTWKACYFCSSRLLPNERRKLHNTHFNGKWCIAHIRFCSKSCVHALSGYAITQRILAGVRSDKRYKIMLTLINQLLSIFPVSSSLSHGWMAVVCVCVCVSVCEYKCKREEGRGCKGTFMPSSLIGVKCYTKQYVYYSIT